MYGLIKMINSDMDQRLFLWELESLKSAVNQGWDTKYNMQKCKMQ